jgi:spermidine synthase
MTDRRLLTVAFSIFTLSGAAGLMYESVWSRYLALFVGHTAYAQVLVLAIFLGGMALGAGTVGRISPRLTDPLRLYGIAEIVVGIIGLLFHTIYLGVTEAAYRSLFQTLGPGFTLTAIKWTIAAGLILPQAFLLGTTFPFMAAGILRRVPGAPGRILSWLYFTNSLGAAVGVLVAGFYLVAAFGLPGTIRTAAIINLVVGAVALWLARGRALAQAPAAEPATGGEPAPATPILPAGISVSFYTRLLLGVSFGTAVASFFYEIGWLRMLSLVLGSATHSFEIMLSAFIFGLATGAFWVRRRADAWTNPLQPLGIVQWVMGFTALATLPLYVASFPWMSWLLSAFAASDAGYTIFSVAKYATSLAVMLPSTFCAGMTLPLITRALILGGSGERAIGTVYSVNTVGSIVGSTVAGLVVLPWIGLRNLLIVGAALDMALGVMLLLVAARAPGSAPRLARASLAALVTVTVVALVSPGFDPALLSSGVFRHGGTRPRGLATVHFYRDGRTASVAAYEGGSPPRIVISTNGKPDGSLGAAWLEPCETGQRPIQLQGDEATQMVGPLVTLAHAPQARRAAVVGHGTGMSTHFLLGDPDLEVVTTVEIEPYMVEGSRAFYPANARAFDDPRGRLVYDDARTFFAAADAPYDVILSVPSNPWVSGVSSLFTVEFYRHIKRYLEDDGVFGQWIHLYEIDDGLVLTVLAAVHREFPSYTVFQTSEGDLLIVASKAATLPEPDWSLFEYPALARDLCRAGAITAEDLEAARVGDREAFAPMLEGRIRPNSDFHPLLDIGAERRRFARSGAMGFQRLPVDGFNLAAAMSDRRLGTPERWRPASLDVWGVVARSKAAYLRADVEPRSEGVPEAGDLRSSRYRQERWLDMLRVNRPPGDWRLWLDHFRAVEGDRLGGTAGAGDSALYRAAAAFAAAHRAPEAVTRAIAFHEALAGWDFLRASRLADTLAENGAYRGWVPAPLLVEGGVTAKLRVGDVGGAKWLFGAVGEQYDRAPTDLRRWLIESYLQATELR